MDDKNEMCFATDDFRLDRQPGACLFVDQSNINKRFLGYPMTQSQRRKKIAELLNQRGECAVEELVAHFKVSGMTIRRDLQALVNERRAFRTHGGAAAAPRATFEFAFLDRLRTHEKVKEAIGIRAAELVKDGQSVLLDSGTTTLAAARALKSRKQLTVITNSLPIACELQYCDQIQVVLLGGILRKETPDLIGALAEANVEQLKVDVALVGVDAIDVKGNAYNASMSEARLLGKMIESATQVYVLADSSKFGRTALVRVGHLASWKGLITDPGISPEIAAALTGVGATIMKASRPSQQGSMRMATTAGFKRLPAG